MLRTGCLLVTAATGVMLIGVRASKADPVAVPRSTVLEEYVAADDPAYSWKIVRTVTRGGCTAFMIDLKSQSWRNSGEVNRTVWQHWLTIVRPPEVRYQTGLLLIGGGRNRPQSPKEPSSRTVHLAIQSQSVVAELSCIPNQPLVLNGDGRDRVEDDLIAYGWAQYLKTKDATWLPFLPMVKSVVRAMDTMTAMLGSEAGGRLRVDKFVIAGASKRGWTTWLTGVADRRVVAIIPIVIDVLNVRASMIHHYSAYGFWAPAINDYVHHGIMRQLDSNGFRELLRHIDPYAHLARLTMPKYVVASTGDQFFLPDSAQFYFDDLKGPKYLRYVPNTDHSLEGSDAVASILAFYQAILAPRPLPRFSWRILDHGGICVRAVDRPRAISLWQATNPLHRDFRLETIGKAYGKTALQLEEDGTCVVEVAAPTRGWTAFFVELVYHLQEGCPPCTFTTPVQVVPKRLPHSIEEHRQTLRSAE